MQLKRKTRTKKIASSPKFRTVDIILTLYPGYSFELIFERKILLETTNIHAIDSLLLRRGCPVLFTPMYRH
jgi:hypothetical protein